MLSFYFITITVSWIIVSIYILINSRKITFLRSVQVKPTDHEPSVAIIVAVKDEETEVETALQSLCKLDYSNFVIVVINDRSTDNTPAILEKVAKSNPLIRLFNITVLPGGWLGKNHALYKGYLSSQSEWLLFTDADIHYERDSLRNAMSFAITHQLDHLTALPEITSPSRLFKSVMNTFSIMLEVRLRPWAASNPKSNAFIGVGAFNLVRRTAYEKCGTHKAISLRPDDDLKLGERIKRSGLAQNVVYGESEIKLKWYTSLSQFVQGLMKNTFSVSNYHLPTAIGMAAITFLVFVLPIPALVLNGKQGQLMAMTILVSQVVLLSFKQGIHGKWWDALMIPFAGCVMIYIIILSAVKTIRQKGIYWRDSFYPLTELKKQR